MATAGFQIAGAVLGLVGGAVTAKAKADAYRAQTAASIVGENVREQQMQFETVRTRRQSIREALLARSTNLTTASNQGALYGSGAGAGKGSGAASSGENQQTANASMILGRRIFQSNKAMHVATGNAEAIMGIGQGIGDLGGTLFDIANPLASIFGN